MCIRPRLAINPVVKSLPLSNLPYIYDGVTHSPKFGHPDIYFAFRMLKSLCTVQDNDDYANYKNSINQTISNVELLKKEVKKYTIFVDGVEYPLFVLYNCGTCFECKKSYQNDIVNRALIEASNSSYVLFYTLTYNDEFVPKFGLCKSHVAAAFKRFRIHIKRYLKIDLDFTQFYVGEYGLNPNFSMRPHYHGIIFIRSKINYIQLKSIIRLFNYGKTNKSYFYDEDHPSLVKFWPYGITDVQIARNPEATTRYVCKYICKQYFGKNNSALSVLKERHHGYYTSFFTQLPKRQGLAGIYFDKYIDEALANGFISLPFGRRVVKVGIPKLYTNYMKMAYHNVGYAPIFECHLFQRLLTHIYNNPYILIDSDYDICDYNVISRYFDLNYSYIFSRPVTKRTKRKLNAAFDFVLSLPNVEISDLMVQMFEHICDNLLTHKDYLSAYRANYELINKLCSFDKRDLKQCISDKLTSLDTTDNYYYKHHNLPHVNE